MVLKDGKVLLGKRNEDSTKADLELHGEETWTMPEEKFEQEESFKKGAKRELLEETGMILKKSKVIYVNCDKNEFAHFITMGFLDEDYFGEPKVMEPDEIKDWK